MLNFFKNVIELKWPAKIANLEGMASNELKTDELHPSENEVSSGMKY